MMRRQNEFNHGSTDIEVAVKVQSALTLPLSYILPAIHYFFIFYLTAMVVGVSSTTNYRSPNPCHYIKFTSGIFHQVIIVSCV